jgi:hypothetical protein
MPHGLKNAPSAVEHAEAGSRVCMFSIGAPQLRILEAPAARDVDDAAPLVTADGRWAATWAETPDAARA